MQLGHGSRCGPHSGAHLIDFRSVAAERTSAAERAARARRAPASGGGFRLPAAETAPRTQQAATMAPAGALDSLLALQVVDDAVHRRRRAAQRGRTLLDLMDSLKIAVLGGRVSVEHLSRIARTLRQREPSGDPALEQIMAEIELRAAVELAKYGQSA
jgi:hypothetical protein